MSGIYIHIPFCRKACHYCDFHFSTSLSLKSELLACIEKEIELQAGTIDNTKIETIYFGGGTPSLLSAIELESILNKISHRFSISTEAEITLEANPDDLDKAYLDELASIGFNRLSIGIQSFFDEDLQYMNRIHNSEESINCIRLVQESQFDNFSVDLIFGGHTTNDEHWNKNLEKASNLDIPHLSIYGLTVEPKTALNHFIKSGKYPPLDDLKFGRQFSYTQAYLSSMGYEQYEVSNYSKKNYRSKHNSAYWSEKQYLGIGPSGHSFVNGARFYNISNNAKYVEAIKNSQIPQKKEILSPTDLYNEYIMTRLRTIEGLRISRIHSFPIFLKKYFEYAKEALIESNELIQAEDQCYIPSDQRIFTDRITQSLFYVA